MPGLQQKCRALSFSTCSALILGFGACRFGGVENALDEGELLEFSLDDSLSSGALHFRTFVVRFIGVVAVLLQTFERVEA